MSRRRWLYTEGGVPLAEPVEISMEQELAPRRPLISTEGVVYSNLRATDGTPIDSRSKHRNYMKANGLALTSDYTNSLQRAQAERNKVFAGNVGFDSHRRKQEIARAFEKVQSKGRRR